ncbi:hypothetical protein FRC06_011268, partial [Ceratobasidium sp. 370]
MERCGEDKHEGGEPALEQESEYEYEDPGMFGEQLVDGEGEEEGEERGQALVDTVRSWLKQQAGVEIGSGGSHKWERQADLDDPNQRSRPRPCLQDTHRISNLQKVNLAPSICWKPIRQ